MTLTGKLIKTAQLGDAQQAGLPMLLTGIVHVKCGEMRQTVYICSSDSTSWEILEAWNKARFGLNYGPAEDAQAFAMYTKGNIDWDGLYLQALMLTHDTRQSSWVYVYVHGKLRGKLSGQA